MILPRDEAELAAAIRDATGPLSVRGGNTRAMAAGGTPLSTSALVGVTLYEPAALTLIAAAGTPLAGIEATLAAEGQRLAFEPMDHRGLTGTRGEPTIGAVVAANVSGPRRVQAGAARDALLGLRFVTGRGEAVQAGGRVMKNVTGYDLARLVAGSRGRLGVIAEVALKVLPTPETEATITVETAGAGMGAGAEAAVACLSAALATPHEVSGAAWLEGRGALLRIEGFADSVAARCAALARQFSSTGTVTVEADPAASAALWRQIRDVVPFHDRAGDVWRLSVRPSTAPAVVARLGAEAVVLDWGGGLIWALMAPGTDLRARAGRIEGHATIVRAGAETRARLGTLPPEAAPVARLGDALARQFDPRGLFAAPPPPAG